MKIIEVKEKQHQKLFLEVADNLYKDDKKWIKPLNSDIEAVFDPQQNPLFKEGECIRWILLDDKNRPIGRIAAFIDENTKDKDNEQATGGIGFFECINKKEAAFLLFDTAKKWLQERKIEAMDGPINFGNRSAWWGLLVAGFCEPNYKIPYNPPYYKKLFEEYGFEVYFKQFTYHRKVGELDHKIHDKAARLEKKKGYAVRPIEKNSIEKYVEDFREVYNKSWTVLEGMKALSVEEAQQAMKELKPIIDEKIIWFAYYQDQPIAFMVFIPELNQIIKHLNGRLNWIGKLKFYYYLKTKKSKKMMGLVFGVVPKFQGRGVESLMIMALYKASKKKGFQYQDVELNWIGDFNPAMMHLAEDLGFSIRKTHITYRKLFDESKVFKRYPIRGIKG